jgi:hypothetical protein
MKAEDLERLRRRMWLEGIFEISQSATANEKNS